MLRNSGSASTSGARTRARAPSLASPAPASFQSLFHPAVAAWLVGSFSAPTPAQAEAWPAIKARRHTLIAAPTGSGKTLAAFLAAIDELVRRGLKGGLTDETHVVYVSPLKALSNDIHRNLEAPLASIREELRRSGLPDVEIRTWVRTGDTPTSERDRMRRRPPHILVTTPELLYVLLGSESGRKMLATAETAIVDEIHAMAPNKRGAHLAVSLERLSALCGDRLLRIGLSATQNPIHEVAHFLVGSAPDGGPAAEVAIIDAGHQRPRDLKLEIPGSPLESVMSGETWTQVYARLAELIEAHRTTLVFVNTRRMAERVARELTERLGERAVTAHHGSMAKELRLAAEQRLKRGELKALVATASLELGIDIGDVNLVCQLGSPRSIATFLQRVGRSGHAIRGTPKGRLFPLSRDDLAECAALIDSVRRGRARPPHDPAPAARRACPADRGRSRGAGLAGGGALRSLQARLALPQARAGGLRRRRPHGGRRLRHPPRPAGRAYSSRRGQWRAARPPRRADDRAHLGRHDSRHRRLSSAAGAGEPGHRHGERGFRGREHGRRHLPARQHVLSHSAGRARDGPGRGREGAAADNSLLARRGAGPDG